MDDEKKLDYTGFGELEKTKFEPDEIVEVYACTTSYTCPTTGCMS